MADYRESEPIKLLCNGCGGELEPNTQCVAASCNHIMCMTCAKKSVEDPSGGSCPLCNAAISKGNVKLVTALQSSHKCKLVLCGQTPEVIADSALYAINFYIEQQRLSGMYLNHQLKQKMAIIQTQCKEKLMQMQHAYQQAKQKLVQTMQQRNALEQDVQELQQKYAQKASQTRKLQEMFKALQQEKDELRRQHEELKRHVGIRSSGGTAGTGPAGRSGIAGRAAGQGSGRQQASPFHGGPPQMVTTVQHTRATFDFSSPASASGLNLLTGHGSAVVGSGNMFGAAGHGMGGGGQRPSTAGGMFAAAALGNCNNRGSGGMGGGPGGGGNALRLQGNASMFGSPAGGFNSL